MANIIQQVSSSDEDVDSDESFPDLGVQANHAKKQEPEAVDLTLSSDIENEVEMIQEQTKETFPLTYDMMNADDLHTAPHLREEVYTTPKFSDEEAEDLYVDLQQPAVKKSKNIKSREEKEVEKYQRKKQREDEKKCRAAEKEMAKARREEEKRMSRAKKPGECLKMLVVELERRLVEAKEGGRVLNQLQESGINCRIVDGPVAASVTFFRINPLSNKESLAEEAIVVLSVENFVLAVSEDMYGLGGREGLCHQCRQWQETLGTSHLSLAICGLEDYLRKQKNEKQQQVKAAVLGKARKCGRVNQHVSRVDIETALVRAQMECQVNHWLLSDGGKVALYVLQMAKAVAEAPYKQEENEALFSWYAEGSSSKCVRIDKNGVGLYKLWQQQLRQFNHVGLEVAQAVAHHYPSPQALVQEYRRCESRQEAELLLAGLRVRRGVGPLVSEKRVGPELSKKIYLFLTSKDPNSILATTR